MGSWVWLRATAIYLLVALLAGGIAYLGNHLGRQIGKKRMSILGMRPRHTSNFITVVTGSVIAISTLSLFAIFSESVRGVIVGIEQSKQELKRLQKEIDVVRRQRDQSRVVWGVGQPILQGTLQPGVPTDQQRERIMGVLDLANALSVQRNNDIAREKREPLLDPSTQLLVWNEDELLALANKMVDEPAVVGVRILADHNCLYKDMVKVRLETLQVNRLFREGDVVATHSVQPENPELLREWYAFLDEVREAALRRGMIEINNSLGGGLSSQDFDRLIQDIKRLQGPGKLVAVAKFDLYETSSLAIRIEVRPAGSAR